MKHSAFAFLAILALVVSLAGPVSANGTAQGKQLTVVLQGLPESCPTGQAMAGELWLVIADNGVPGKQAVTIRVTVDTPFGDVNVYNANFRMERGQKRMIPLNIPVGYRVPTGNYHFDVTVSVKGDSVTVGHDVYIFSAK